MPCSGNYNTLCKYNENRRLCPRPDIACNSMVTYNNYFNATCGRCEPMQQCLSKGTICFSYTPESNSCWENKRCC